ncbi:unnamed protein product [Rotaria socialis]|uniref:Alanine racemase N-terminal domain-containing protein n=4 Tax=Rotaria socialis TaxID=392032 RepID=A0A818HR62_9BILA|nr:unnamed protein product [Rotaria socialis]CAF3510535.1 unnamed protein product [Rotaria socialis]CAF4162917.1 unnamed protein product [Rotaria socialis]CAF4221600.1 unnamed protein product [Rotaria socialis]CAF4236294.1 unnamed protein product [Rotaria socialis]
MNLALKEQRSGASAGIIDLDRLDSNVHFVQKQLGDGYQLRLVTKSLPSLDLLKYMMVKVQTNRLMVFSESFLAEILSNLNPDSLDILLGTPLPVDAFIRLVAYNGWNTINWLIDTNERLNQYLYYAQQEHIRIKINLEIDVGLHRGGFEITKDFAEAVEIIKQNSQYLELTGLMGYDGHVPYVPFYINKERSIRKTFVHVQELYDQFVDELKKHYDAKAMSTMTFNSGGSHTYFYYSDYKSATPVNDIAVGSGFLAPKQFSDLIELGHQPALFLSAPVLKKIESSKLPHAEKLSALVNIWDPNLKTSYFMLGGGWPGELVGPMGLKRNHWWDENDLGYTNQLPNQSILSGSDENTLNVSDFIFYHPWEGDGMLCFKKLVLYRQNSIVGEWDTYKGGN